MNCQLCGESLPDEDSLQLHHINNCNAIEKVNYEIGVKLIWEVVCEVKADTIHLLGSNEINNVALHRLDGCFESDLINLEEGTYSGQLVIGDELHPIAEFHVDSTSQTVYLMLEGGDKSEEADYPNDFEDNNDDVKNLDEQEIEENITEEGEEHSLDNDELNNEFAPEMQDPDMVQSEGKCFDDSLIGLNNEEDSEVNSGDDGGHSGDDQVYFRDNAAHSRDNTVTSKVVSGGDENGRKISMVEENSEEDPLIVQLRGQCSAYENQVNALRKEVERLTNLSLNYKEVKAELETKCQSYDDEIARLNRCLSVARQDAKEGSENFFSSNQLLQKRYENLEHKCLAMERELHQKKKGLQQNASPPDTARCKQLEMDKLHLTNEYRSLQAAHLLREEDLLKEIKNLKQVVDMLKKENSKQHKTVSIVQPSNDARVNIEKLKQENNLLKSKLNAIRLESELGHNNDSRNSFLFTKRTSDISPVEYQDIKARCSYSNGDVTRSSYHSPNDSLDYNYNTHASKKPYTSLSSKTTLDRILKRYSTGSSRDDTPIHAPETGNRQFQQRKRNLKARSLDLGLDNLGRMDDSVQYTRIPFCPNNVHDLTAGMQVSVNRCTGRLARGRVKWIGVLPNHSDHYIGIELETESGKNSGDFAGNQYFHCKPGRGVFVRFSKIIMAWK